MSNDSAGAILTDDDYQAILSTVEAAARDAGAIITIRGAMWAPIFRAVEHAIAAAEQRGREDNADHGMCYVSGSAALAAKMAAAWDEGAGAVEFDQFAEEFVVPANPYRVTP